MGNTHMLHRNKSETKKYKLFIHSEYHSINQFNVIYETKHIILHMDKTL